MSFDLFLSTFSDRVKMTSLQQAYDFVTYRGEISMDSMQHEAYHFWRALHYFRKSQDMEIGLYERCSAMRMSRLEWRRFQKSVIPIANLRPMVPDLPTFDST